MSEIIKIKSNQVLDSRGLPTVQTEVWTKNKGYGKAIVPSGASTGSLEAYELRDKGSSYHGNSVLKAVENVNKIIGPKIISKKFDVTNQKEIDNEMIEMGGENLKILGANAVLSVSLAICRAAAKELNKELYLYINENLSSNCNLQLPVPLINIINGGKHADNNLSFQEFMIVPVGANSFAEAMQMSSEVFHTLKKILKNDKHNTSVGDEGGFAPNLKNDEEALALITRSIKESGYQMKKDFMLALDCAASEFYNEEENNYDLYDKKKIDSEELINYLIYLKEKYNLISIEDGLAEDDWTGFKNLFLKSEKKMQIVGDDIFVTNPLIIKDAIKDEIANSVLIKLNQIGTVTKTLEAVELAKNNGWTAIISHRSGETEDTSIADFAVGLGTGQIKTGSVSRTERICKYNRLLNIEMNNEKRISFAGKNAFYNLKKEN